MDHRRRWDLTLEAFFNPRELRKNGEMMGILIYPVFSQAVEAGMGLRNVLTPGKIFQLRLEHSMRGG